MVSEDRLFNICIFSCTSILIFLSFIFVTIAGINDNKYIPGADKCEVFPNMTSYGYDKSFDQWNWNYQSTTHPSTTFSGKIQHKCPTFTHSVDIYLNNKLVTRALRNMLSFTQRTDLYDCHKNPIGHIQSGDFGQTLINSNKIFTSFQFRNTNDKILAYVDGKNFFSNNFIIKDINGNHIAKIKRNLIAVPWNWEFIIYNTNHFVADGRILSSIAGLKAFDDGKNTDICNLFYILSISVLSITGFFFLFGLGFFKYNQYTKK